MINHTATLPSRLRAPAATISRGGLIFVALLLMVVFEGAIRKWITSSASLPLILLRDLLAIYLVLFAWRGGYLRRYQKVTGALLAWTLLVVGWGLLQLVGGESTPVVFLIGLRFWLLYTWFGVAAAATMTETDYAIAARTAVAVMIILAPLVILQHYSPPGAAVNRQLDGDEESVFVVVAGVVRTTGTFSFTSGYASYLLAVAPLIFGLLGARKRTKMQLFFALAGFGAFIVGSVLSGSRTAVLSAGAMFGVYLIARLVFARLKDKPAALGAVALAAISAVGFLLFFSEAIQITQTRFEQAAEAENFWQRLLSIVLGEPGALDQASWLGQGLGVGSNLAASLYNSGVNFALAESETGRIVLEGGILGFAFVALKIAFIVGGFMYSLRLCISRHAAYPLMSWLAVVIGVMTWQATGQLTSNALLGLLLAFFFLLFRYPSSNFFLTRQST